MTRDGQLGELGLDGSRDREEDVTPLRGREPPPAAVRECLLVCPVDSERNLRCAGVGNLGDKRASSRVEDAVRLAADRAHGDAVDPQLGPRDALGRGPSRCSYGRVPAVNDEEGSGDPTGVVAGQEERHLCDVLGLAPAPKRDVRFHGAVYLGREGPGQGSPDGAGKDAVTPNLVLRVLHGQRPGYRHDTTLGRRVGVGGS